MPSFSAPLPPILLIVAFGLLAAPVQDTSSSRVDCHEWRHCRQLANDAADRKNFEVFHDLAWRTVQTGPKNDPELMYLLARAQSLSGRPDDALVMLQRLAGMGVPNDAATNDDFRAVRALSRWAELESKGPGVRGEATGNRAEGTRSATPAAEVATTGTRAANESLRFRTLEFKPAGLAYDAVSRRFIVGDRHARKLAVVDEFSSHVANLASAQATGFGEIAALEIDPQQGTLWVVSADDRQTALYKLQLVSARLLARYDAGQGLGPVRFVDVAAAGGGVALALDRTGHRVFRLRPKAESLELAATLPDKRPASMAPASDGLLYVAHDGGVTRVDLASRSTTLVRAGAGVDLNGIARLRWHRGALIAIQQTGTGPYRAIRVVLDRAGRTATAIEILDASLPTTDPTAATVTGGVLYYLASGQGTEMVVRKVALQ